MKIHYLILMAAVAACSGKDKKTSPDILAAPTEVTASLSGTDAVRLSWKDNCDGEAGYYVFLRAGENARKLVETLPANAASYTFEGLEPGNTYRFGAQAFGEGNAMSASVFSEPVTLPEPTPEPPAPEPGIKFNWTAVSGLDIPDAVKVYKTDDPLNGRPFNAWYAIADCAKDVEFRVLYPGNGNARTVDDQAEEAGDCLVLVNGGIFSGKYLEPIGFAITDGEQTPWRVVEDDGQRVDREYWSADGKLHPVSRGMFGVDKTGKPAVYWSFTPEWGTVYVYDEPIPSTAGETPCPPGSTTYPSAPADWTPWNAVTCGPVLLKDGHCPITDEKTEKGYWKTNYELWADDIYGVTQHPDRTAVGYTADGKVILFICDGRIAASDGATTLETAQIMAGLGCVGALNLDGGGSTSMWARGGGKRLNSNLKGNGTDTEERAVLTTLGFFNKR